MATPNLERATLAAGCFWGVEHLYRKHFLTRGLHDVRVGYIGGDVSNPDYKSVCQGTTGQTDAEAVQLLYDPTQLSFRTLLDFFFRIHDPTTLNAQGCNKGTNYRSGIFTHSEEQRVIAQEMIKKVGEQWWKEPVTTVVAEAGEWWDAEDYHQMYLIKNPEGYVCASHFVRDFPPLE